MCIYIYIYTCLRHIFICSPPPEEFPTRGSAGHPSQCKPCAFKWTKAALLLFICSF